MPLSPLIAVHLSAAIAATLIGPLALWVHPGHTQHPRLHRAFGYAWVTLMLATAISALFIRDFRLPNLAGYTPIHLLIPVTGFWLVMSFWHLARHNIAGHRRAMQRLYLATCIVAGAFTLLPGRLLGDLLLHQLRVLS